MDRALANECSRTLKLISYHETAVCYNNNWLYQGESRNQWLITPLNSHPDRAFYVYVGGSVYDGDDFLPSLAYSVRNEWAYSPVMALSNDVLVSGSGTKTDPYVMN